MHKMTLETPLAPRVGWGWLRGWSDLRPSGSPPCARGGLLFVWGRGHSRIPLMASSTPWPRAAISRASHSAKGVIRAIAEAISGNFSENVPLRDKTGLQCRKKLLCCCTVIHANASTQETALGRLIREQGRVKGWVAEQLGCDPSRLSRLISGARSMTLVEAARAAALFGVPIETFVPPEAGVMT